MNPQINKQIAAQVAAILTKKQKDAYVEAEKKKSLFIEDLAKRKTPKEVTIAFEKYPHYFRTQKYIYVDGQGIVRGKNCITLSESIPSNGEHLSLSAIEAKKYVQLLHESEKLKATYENITKEVENALLACRTYNKIKELLPEAYPHLPVKYSPPALNFTDIRKKLK